MPDKVGIIYSFIASQILGDGCSRNTNIRVLHGKEWEQYLYWKITIANRLGVAVSSVRNEECLNNIIDRQKRVVATFFPPRECLNYTSPVELVHRLDPLGLLLWWLDDGCLIVHEKRNGISVSRFGYLCTEAYDENTNRLLSLALLEKFGLSTSVHIDRGGILSPDNIYYRLYLSATSMRNLIDIVRPFIHEVPHCMMYKLNMDYRPNRLLSSLENSLRYNFN